MNTTINNTNSQNQTSSTRSLKPVALPDDVAEALRRVIEYLWNDEYRDYQATGRAHRENHICKQLHRLRVWLRFPEARVTPS